MFAKLAPVADTISFPPYQIDQAGDRLWRGGELIEIRPKAFAVLKYLTAHPGQLIRKEQILGAVWPDVYVDESVLKVTIGEVRKALADTSRQPRFIETAYGRGYRFIGQVHAEPGDFPADSSTPAVWVPETHYARSGDVDIAYQVLGDGPIDLAFVMGWVSHLEYFWTEPSFARFLRKLATFCRLILFDKRGTGLSDRVPLTQLPTLEQRMGDLQAVMDAAGSKRAVLCGVSEGAAMAVLFAARCPERTASVVMIGPYAKRIRDHSYPWGPTEAERELFLEEIREHWGGPVGLEERAPSVASDLRFRQWWATYLRMSASPGAAVALTRMNSQADIRSVLPDVRVPSLVLHRTGDRCLNVEEGRYVANLIPGARFVELPGIDHLPFVGDQDSIIDEIQKFLASTCPGAGAGERADAVLCASFKVPRGEPRLRPSLRRRLKEELQEEAERFGGSGLTWDRDRLFVSFRDPEAAIRCAWVLAEYASRSDLEWRAGIEIGECTIDERRPERSAVDHARAIEALAGPGETLVSAAVRDLSECAGIEFRARGSVAGSGASGVEVLGAEPAATHSAAPATDRLARL
ncbi:MAG TPA: alpha/beta fold hydrolase [Bryobacteraceae bacterium]